MSPMLVRCRLGNSLSTMAPRRLALLAEAWPPQFARNGIHVPLVNNSRRSFDHVGLRPRPCWLLQQQTRLGVLCVEEWRGGRRREWCVHAAADAGLKGEGFGFGGVVNPPPPPSLLQNPKLVWGLGGGGSVVTPSPPTQNPKLVWGWGRGSYPSTPKPQTSLRFGGREGRVTPLLPHTHTTPPNWKQVWGLGLPSPTWKNEIFFFKKKKQTKKKNSEILSKKKQKTTRNRKNNKWATWWK